jgi:hypothetical protein
MMAANLLIRNKNIGRFDADRYWLGSRCCLLPGLGLLPEAATAPVIGLGMTSHNAVVEGSCVIKYKLYSEKCFNFY